MDTYTLAPAPHDYAPSYEDSKLTHAETAYYMLYIQMGVYPHESSNDNALCSD
jgi:hypothetical protein